jgi:hypothetical protein
MSMSRSTAGRLAGVALIGGTLLGVACGKDSAGPVGPKTMVSLAGEGQAAPTGATLSVPLRVTVTGSDGQPYPGATVTWTVPTGSATPAPAVSASDAQGVASTVLTLGGQVGPVVVQASVPGVAPVSFHATALDPCTFRVAYTLGTTVTAALATTDCLVGGNFYTDYYSTTFAAQQGLTLTLTSTTYDTWLDLFRGDGAYLAFNDDIDPGIIRDSRIEAIVAPGNYVFAPNSFDALVTGAYSFSAAARSQTVSACALVWVTRGVTVTDSVTAADCSDTDSTGTYYSDGVALIAFSGTVLTITQRSGVFDAFLTVLRYDAAGDSLILVAANDDSAGVGPNSHVVVTVPVAAVYFVFAGTSGASATGAYDLAISSSTTASAAAAAPGVGRAGSLPFVPGLRMPKVRGWGSSPLPRGARFR